jgi:hypothetical protein
MVCLEPRSDFLDPNPTNTGESKWLKPYVARWSLFLTLCWISELLIWRIIGALPRIITSTVFFFTKKSNEKLDLIAESMVALRFWATWPLWMIVIQALYTLFFQNNVPAGILPTDSSVTIQYTLLGAIITTVMVFSIIVFIQKFYMHFIAVNFHRSAYSGRIERSKKSVRYIDRLRKSLKRFNFKMSPTLKNLTGPKKVEEMDQVPSNTKPGLSPDSAELNIDIEPTTENGEKVEKKPKYSSWKSFFPSASPKMSILPNIQLAGAMEVANDRQAKRFAKQLFMNMKRSDREELLLEDFEK